MGYVAVFDQSGTRAFEGPRARARTGGACRQLRVTDTLVAEVDRALTAHELIKVKIGTDDRADRVAIGDEICARTGATAVHRVGKVIILWRPRPTDPPD